MGKEDIRRQKQKKLNHYFNRDFIMKGKTVSCEGLDVKDCMSTENVSLETNKQ